MKSKSSIKGEFSKAYFVIVACPSLLSLAIYGNLKCFEERISNLSLPIFLVKSYPQCYF